MHACCLVRLYLMLQGFHYSTLGVPGEVLEHAAAARAIVRETWFEWDSKSDYFDVKQPAIAILMPRYE